MTEAASRKLRPGIYQVFWHEGAPSVAAIGRDELRKPWLAPVDFAHPVMPQAAPGMFQLVKRVVPLKVSLSRKHAGVRT